ncbi:hypothetical protein N7448_001444 [Penicillium atrosanguineum]|uniref:Beta-lactamase-related domain-containing protein n=1 Tax=Penicillium atrosanguineum TaxID=1132637 RepID=A0A9W9LD86_9EURO|nr:hypothetical protein N7448_001444 [Penicillium atrosanguineum]KAJ5324646.1 hypothetical protein N7476_003246 [Penicillium atrosanguineum]
MYSFTRLLPLLPLFCTSVVNAVNPCPILGPIWPAATGLSSDPVVIEALQNITTTIEHAIDAGNFSSDSISLQIFDANDPGALLSLFNTAADINTTLGVSDVDENTVFRIGSTSKLFTMFMLLIENGLGPMQDPVADYIPELRDAIIDLFRNSTNWDNGIDFTKWNEVTVGELATHMAGIGRDCKCSWLDPGLTSLVTLTESLDGVLDFTEQASTVEALGFPALPTSQIPTCGVPFPCDRKHFFKGMVQRHPIVPTSRTPIYSNAAFQILGYVVEAMAGDDYSKVLSDDILKPLNLSRTSYGAPDTSLGVIPNKGGLEWWNFAMGDEIPAGGIYSSAKDMATIGRAILNSTLLPPALTRRWLKPVSHTSSLDYGVGAPWEILSFGSERPIDLYTKSGDIGTYSSVFALSPDHGVGFVVLGAGANTHKSLALASDLVSAILIPALEKSAKKQAAKRFAGTYALDSANSSITISTDDGPGLLVTNWISDSSSMAAAFMSLNGMTGPSQLSTRLYPTGLESPGKISFRAVTPPALPSGIGPFTSSCITWFTVDSQVYGSVGIDEFVFNLDQTGNAVSVTPRVLRTTMKKT